MAHLGDVGSLLSLRFEARGSPPISSGSEIWGILVKTQGGGGAFGPPLIHRARAPAVRRGGSVLAGLTGGDLRPQRSA